MIKQLFLILNVDTISLLLYTLSREFLSLSLSHTHTHTHTHSLTHSLIHSLTQIYCRHKIFLTLQLLWHLTILYKFAFLLFNIIDQHFRVNLDTCSLDCCPIVVTLLSLLLSYCCQALLHCWQCIIQLLLLLFQLYFSLLTYCFLVAFWMKMTFIQ